MPAQNLEEFEAGHIVAPISIGANASKTVTAKRA